MPDPALPYVPPQPSEMPQEAPEAPGGTNYTREYHDLQGRPYSGHVTLTAAEPPRYSVEADIVDGRVALAVPAGLYNMKAMLRDPDGVRAFICEDINVRVQEGS